MQKTDKVGFTEQSKAVTCDVKVEYSFDVTETNIDEKAIEEEAEHLFNIAQKFSKTKTLEKAMR